MADSDKKPVLVNFPAEVIEKIDSEVLNRQMDRTSWIIEAVAEKLARVSGEHGESARLYDGLSAHDRELVEKLADCLRRSDSDGFRRAVDANFTWLLETVASSRRQRPRSTR